MGSWVLSALAPRPSPLAPHLSPLTQEELIVSQWLDAIQGSTPISHLPSRQTPVLSRLAAFRKRALL